MTIWSFLPVFLWHRSAVHFHLSLQVTDFRQEGHCGPWYALEWEASDPWTCLRDISHKVTHDCKRWDTATQKAPSSLAFLKPTAVQTNKNNNSSALQLSPNENTTCVCTLLSYSSWFDCIPVYTLMYFNIYTVF